MSRHNSGDCLQTSVNCEYNCHEASVLGPAWIVSTGILLQSSWEEFYIAICVILLLKPKFNLNNTLKCSSCDTHIHTHTLYLDLGPFFSFLILYIIGRTPWTGAQPVARPLPTHRTTQTHNKSTQTSMPRVGFEPTIPVFERTKTVHALDRVATGSHTRTQAHTHTQCIVIVNMKEVRALRREPHAKFMNAQCEQSAKCF
jgi:hypothetical protein